MTIKEFVFIAVDGLNRVTDYIILHLESTKPQAETQSALSIFFHL